MVRIFQYNQIKHKDSKKDINKKSNYKSYKSLPPEKLVISWVIILLADSFSKKSKQQFPVF
jgi:hypothetical protein